MSPKLALRTAAIACGMAVSIAASGQTWPAKPIKLILGYEPVANTPEQFAAVIRNDLDKWRRVVAEAKIKVD